MNRSWLYVFIGGIVEVFWVSGLKHADTVFEWILTGITIIISFSLIVAATKRLPIGTVYAVFTGLGTGGTVLAEMLVFGEPFRISKVLLILLLLVGVMGLKMITDNHEQQQEVTV
ncbi:paired small multidrug resistance pump [Paenibacillus sp. DS2015]|uniref:DMT family transporter n=1 Tax=Paenibacillus sp. DS2015 TaxID=3373917 RepID=UPI003D19C11B